jgi:hypothetical protein
MDEYRREEHEAVWEWDNVAALYRCAVLWPDGSACSNFDAGVFWAPAGAVHVRVVADA